MKKVLYATSLLLCAAPAYADQPVISIVCDHGQADFVPAGWHQTMPGIYATQRGGGRITNCSSHDITVIDPKATVDALPID